MAGSVSPSRSSRSLGLALVALGFVAGIASLLVGSWADGAWGPRILPLLAAATLVATGAVVTLAPQAPSSLAVEGEAAAGGASAEPPASEFGPAWLVGLAVLYVLAIDRLGYLVATALAAPAAFWLFGVRRPLALSIAATLVPLALHLAFFRLLGVFPPLGRWFDLLDHVPL